MPFTFKLSKRLAQMHRQVLLASAAALAACMGAETTIVGPNQPGSVSRMQLSPNSVTLLPNQTTSFTAVGFTAVGDTAMGMTVSWSVTAGAITGTSTSGGNHYGSYKSGSQPGKYKVTAQGPGGKCVGRPLVPHTVTLDEEHVGPIGRPAVARPSVEEVAASHRQVPDLRDVAADDHRPPEVDGSPLEAAEGRHPQDLEP